MDYDLHIDELWYKYHNDMPKKELRGRLFVIW